MDLFEAIRGRRSVRRYLPDPVPEGDLRRILEAAIWAPSAGNLQSWEFVVVRDPARKEALARAAYGQGFVAQAPAVVVVCADRARSASEYGRRGWELYSIQDAAAATQNMLLAAHALGYGSCWVGAFDEGEVSRILGLPPRVRPLAIVPIGRPAEEPEPPPRLPLERVTHQEEF